MQNYRNLSHVQRDLSSGVINLQDLVDHYLEKIDNSSLNTFLEVFASSANEQAAVISEKMANGTAGRLAGMVLGIKDNIVYKGHASTSSSKILQGFESIYSATAVERLLAEDAIIIGRLNCDEFAMGSSNENSAYGPVGHPIDADYVPGGSSGGSASAVAAGLCLASLGSDTGGSVRQPASFCGVVGLKPTYGRISRYGLMAYASSFDQIGCFTHDVDDCALLLEIMAGHDDYDSTASLEKVDDYTNFDTNKKYKIAYIKEALEMPGTDPEIAAQFKARLDELKSQGHEIEEMSFAYMDHLVPAYYVLTTAEASSNLSRYDGIRYGYRSNEAVDIASTYIKSRSEGFGKEVKNRIMLGTFVLSSGYYDAYYGKAQKMRRIIQNDVLKVLEDNDFIILPTCPTTTFKKGDIKDPIAMYLQDIFTVLANLCGLPAVSLPLDNHTNGFPYGTQLISSAYTEKKLLSFSKDLMSK